MLHTHLQTHVSLVPFGSVCRRRGIIISSYSSLFSCQFLVRCSLPSLLLFLSLACFLSFTYIAIIHSCYPSLLLLLVVDIFLHPQPSAGQQKTETTQCSSDYSQALAVRHLALFTRCHSQFFVCGFSSFARVEISKETPWTLFSQTLLAISVGGP